MIFFLKTVFSFNGSIILFQIFVQIPYDVPVEKCTRKAAFA